MTKYKCFLDAELNRCKNFIQDGSLCLNASPDNKCGMLIKEEDQQETDGFNRAPRWYEKYYE